MSDAPAVKLGFAKVEHEIIDDLRKIARDATMDLLSVKKDLFQAQSELSATQQKLEAAEARIKASQEQEPAVVIAGVSKLAIEIVDANGNDIEWDVLGVGAKFYAAPVIPPDVQEVMDELLETSDKLEELQRKLDDSETLRRQYFVKMCEVIEKNGELTQKLVEQHDIANANFLWPFEDGSIESIGYEFANAKTEEYQKEQWVLLLSEAKSKAVPEDALKFIEMWSGENKHALTQHDQGARWACIELKAMLAAAPQPETDIDQAQR